MGIAQSLQVRAINLVGFGHVLTFDLSPWACTRLMNIIKGAIGRGNQSVLTPPTFAHAWPIHWEYSTGDSTSLFKARNDHFWGRNLACKRLKRVYNSHVIYTPYSTTGTGPLRVLHFRFRCFVKIPFHLAFSVSGDTGNLYFT